MAPRSNWKGFLKLSLVSCPVQLFPATTSKERVTFNLLNQGKEFHHVWIVRLEDGRTMQDVHAALKNPGETASTKQWKQAVAVVRSHDMPPDDHETTLRGPS